MSSRNTANVGAVVGAAREVVRNAKLHGSDILMYQSFAVLDAELRALDENVPAPVAASEPVAWDDRAQQHRVLSELQEILHEAAEHGISPSFDLLGAVRNLIAPPSAAAEPVSQPYTLASEPVAWSAGELVFAANALSKALQEGISLEECCRRVLAAHHSEYPAHPSAAVVSELDEWRVVDKDGKQAPFTRGTSRFDEAKASAKDQDERWPEHAPHRVMRVCLREEPAASEGASA